jgi:GntR family negative regulator for fad regulon and positive regulator of fabA
MPPKERAADLAERLLIQRILDGTYPPGGDLPGERVLCKEFGVARPALREALQRLSRDGWIDIQHGKSTRVMDLMHDGTLSILAGLLKVESRLYGNFVPDVLEMWSLLAPVYTARAVERAPRPIVELLDGFRGIDDRAEPTVRAMWRMHRTLIDLCGNLVFGLVFNSFSDFYRRLATVYYRDPRLRAGAHDFWVALREASAAGDSAAAASLIREYVARTQDFWQNAAIYDLAAGADDEDGGDGEES